MNKFGQKGNIANDDFMIHILNNLPKDYNVILDGLENHLMVIRDDVLTINVICKKLSHWYKKIESKKEEKTEKEKALGAYNKQYKQRCHKCGKYGYKLAIKNVLKMKMKNENKNKQEKMAH